MQPSFQEWLNRGSPKANKRKRLAPMSKKRKEDSKKYSALRAKFLRAHPLCMARRKGCTMKATDIHHKAGRGKNYLDQATWLPACRTCHNWIHNNPSGARALGLLE